MTKKLLPTSSLRAMELAQLFECSANFYPENAVLLKALPKGSVPEQEAQYPSDICFEVLDLRGYVIASLICPSYYAACEHITHERCEVPLHIN
jgi:hypothetical protein